MQCSKQSWPRGSSQLLKFQKACLTLDNTVQSRDEAEAVVAFAQEQDYQRPPVVKATSEVKADLVKSK